MSFGKTLTLSTGATIPQIGLGTWQAPPGEVGAAVCEFSSSFFTIYLTPGTARVCCPKWLSSS